VSTPRKKKPRPPGEATTLFKEVHGEDLRGRVVGGRWRFTSSIPGLAEQLDGSAECALPVEVFTRLAAAGRNPVAAVKAIAAELRTARAKGGAS
jgi:hypothetical protein